MRILTNPLGPIIHKKNKLNIYEKLSFYFLKSFVKKIFKSLEIFLGGGAINVMRKPKHTHCFFD